MRDLPGSLLPAPNSHLDLTLIQALALKQEMAGCQFTESEKKEFVILNTRKPISPLDQVLELSFSRLAMSLVEQVLPLLPDPVPGSHLLCHHSPCLQ